MLTRISFVALSFYLTAASLLAQADPEPVSSPHRGTTYADDAGEWYSQPFIWIGLMIVLLVVVLLMLRGKNRPVHGHTGRTSDQARPRDGKPAS